MGRARVGPVLGLGHQRGLDLHHLGALRRLHPCAGDARLARFEKEFAALPADRLSPDNRYDLRIIQKEIAYGRWSNEQVRIYTRNPLTYAAVAGVLVAVTLLPLHASSPKFFQAATQTDFLKGDVENLSIDSHGQLTLGPVTELVYETSAPFLWCGGSAAPRLDAAGRPDSSARRCSARTPGQFERPIHDGVSGVGPGKRLHTLAHRREPCRIGA